MANGDSPFSPGKPVTPELFVGRDQEIRRFEAKLKKCANGSIESVFLTGERGIGKSSFARVMGVYANSELHLAPIYCQLIAARDLDETLQILSQKILQNFPRGTVLDKIRGVFDRYIDEFDLQLFPVSAKIGLKKDADSRRQLRLNFPDLLVSTIKNIKGNYDGLFLILDDLNGVTKDPNFGNFIKNLVDGLVTGGYEKIPLALALIGIGERLDDMSKAQPSVARVFDVIYLPRLSPNEVKNFYNMAFKKVGLKVAEGALDNLTFWSGGMPAIMHEIGDAAFSVNKDETIDENDATEGCVIAADNIGRKYMEPRVFEKLSKSYQNLLDYVAKQGLGTTITRQMLISDGNEKDSSVDNFLSKMSELGVFHRGENPGEYRFSRDIYSLYNYLRSLRRRATS